MPFTTRNCPGCKRDIDVRGFATHSRHCQKKNPAIPATVPVVSEEPRRTRKATSSRAMGKFGVWLTTKGSEYVALHTLEEIQAAFQQDTSLEVGAHAAKGFILGEGWKVRRKVPARYTAENTIQVLALTVASLYRQLGEEMPVLFVDVLQGRPVDIDALNRLHEEVVSQDYVGRVIPIAAHA